MSIYQSKYEAFNLSLANLFQIEYNPHNLTEAEAEWSWSAVKRGNLPPFKGQNSIYIIEATCLTTGKITRYEGQNELTKAGFNFRHVYSCADGKGRTKHLNHTFKKVAKATGEVVAPTGGS